MAVIEGITAMEGYKNKSSLYIKLINNSNVPFYYNIKTTIVNKNGTYYITKADGELFDKYAEAGDVSGMYSILDKYNIPHA